MSGHARKTVNGHVRVLVNTNSGRKDRFVLARELSAIASVNFVRMRNGEMSIEQRRKHQRRKTAFAAGKTRSKDDDFEKSWEKVHTRENTGFHPWGGKE